MTTKELLKKEIETLPNEIAENVYKLIVSVKELASTKTKLRRKRSFKMEDETGYLLKSPANKKRLLSSVDYVKKKKNLVVVDLKDLRWEK